MNDTNSAARDLIVTTARALDAAGLMPNKSGNVSCRDGDSFLVTPSGVPYVTLEAAQVVRVAPDGGTEPGAPRPSSEWRLHAAIYAARADAQAIVHTHSPMATALACAGLPLPAFHYMIALAGGDVRCAPYATFGTEELARHAVAGLVGRRAVLLANHGVVAIGPSLEAATAVALEVENMSSQYLALRAAGLEPRALDLAELDTVMRKFGDYGRPVPDPGTC
ncbi:MAG: class II aldolase/adducin family protein [Steroidobacteraceae bacterium]